MATTYTSISRNTPYGSGDPYYNSSTGYITPSKLPRKKVSNWIKFGIPVAVLLIAGAVLGGVFGSRAHKSASANSTASAAIQAKNDVGIFPTGTDSLYMMPIYAATTNTAAFTMPTFVSTPKPNIAWPRDPFQPSNPSLTQVRPDRPRLITPLYKWRALPDLIAQDPYLYSWNRTIHLNASQYMSQPPVPYVMDGGNGILDAARQIKQRVKAFSYVYRMTNDTKWLDRVLLELKNAVGNGTAPWGPNDITRWNPTHFLDVSEMLAAFSVAYDHLYEHWTPEQLESIRYTMIQYGLNHGVTAYSNNDPMYYGWWTNNTKGNWNCVCNAGLIMASLAIIGDDHSGIAEYLLSVAVPNAVQNCAFATSDDGSWSETNDYWYFGTTGHAEMVASLSTATGSSFNLLDANPGLKLSGDYHMYSTGPGSRFGHGDTGPNKYSSTANSMFLYGNHFNIPRYQLYQRDQDDAPEPWSMFWYNPAIVGAFWYNLELDHFFSNEADQWAAIRSSWTDESALFVAVKAGTLQGHEVHNDLDCGDFVIDALGRRFAGQLGSGNYLSAGYFSSESQDSQRWLYYRKRTEGQNTILIGGENQDVRAQPTANFHSSGTVQGSSTVFDVPGDSKAFFTTDMSTAYFNATKVWRGIRVMNKRQQVLIQDEIDASAAVMWRMHTNATVGLGDNNLTATLTIGSKIVDVSLLSPPSGAQFSTMDAVRLPTDPPTPDGWPDQRNDGVTVLLISLPPGQYTLEVVFTPRWPGVSSSAYVMPSSVPLNQWTLDSHP